MHIKRILFITIFFLTQYLLGADHEQRPYDLNDDLKPHVLTIFRDGCKNKHEEKTQQAAQWLAGFYVAAHNQKQHIEVSDLNSELEQRAICREILKKWCVFTTRSRFLSRYFSGDITALTYDNEATRVAIGCANGSIVEFDINTLWEKDKFNNFQDCPKLKRVHSSKPIKALCYSPEDRLSSFDGEVVKIWPREGQNDEFMQLRHEAYNPWLAMGYTPQGELVHVCKNELKKGKFVYKPEKGREVWDSIERITFQEECDKACFSSNGGYIAVSKDKKEVHVRDLQEMQTITNFTVSFPVDAFCVHNDASMFALAHTISKEHGESCEKGSRIMLSSQEKGHEIFEILDHWKVNHMHFSHDGKKLACQTRNNLYVSDTSRHLEENINVFHDEKGIATIAWHPKQLQIAQAIAGEVIIRDFVSLDSVDSIEQALKFHDLLSQRDLSNHNENNAHDH